MTLRLAAALACCAFSAPSASISGIVKDAQGKPVENARIDHIGKAVVVGPPGLKPESGEVRTDEAGRFRITTTAPAIVIRKPGFESRRVRVEDAGELQITLLRARSAARCSLSAIPDVKTRNASDVDYTAQWLYLTPTQGILSGHGPMYSWGAPSDDKVWTSAEYREVMLENGVIDAAGRPADGSYWRSRSVFGAAARYSGQTAQAAGQLDCVMDRIALPLPNWRSQDP